MLSLRAFGSMCMLRSLRMFFSVPAITDSREELGVSGACSRVSVRSRELGEIRRVCTARHLRTVIQRCRGNAFYPYCIHRVCAPANVMTLFEHTLVCCFWTDLYRQYARCKAGLFAVFCIQQLDPLATHAIG